MSNPFTDTRQAIQSYLDSDATLASFLQEGTKFYFETYDRKPLEIARADCPILAMGPTEIPLAWADNVNQDLSYTLNFDLRVGDDDISQLEEFIYIVWQDLLKGEQARFGLSNGFYMADMQPVTIRGLYDEQDNRESSVIWQAEFNYVCRIRLDLRT